MVIHDTECRYWDQLLLCNTRLNSNSNLEMMLIYNFYTNAWNITIVLKKIKYINEHVRFNLWDHYECVYIPQMLCKGFSAWAIFRTIFHWRIVPKILTVWNNLMMWNTIELFFCSTWAHYVPVTWGVWQWACSAVNRWTQSTRRRWLTQRVLPWSSRPAPYTRPVHRICCYKKYVSMYLTEFLYTVKSCVLLE